MVSWQRSPSPEVADRLPPGQVLTLKFPVLQFGQVPSYPDLSGWDLRIWGAVEHPITLKWAEVRQLPIRQVTLDIHCVTRWSKLDTVWEGAPLTHLAEAVGVKRDAHHVVFHSEYGYTANVPLEIALQPDALVAWNFAGQPLEAEHGYPLRALVPGRYFWKSAKWLRGVEFSVEDRPGFWERNGYHNNADPWREERYSDD
jgi:DMSO/TMAO reductase YedYZ molybdopterin-dependent catalytic subunit